MTERIFIKDALERLKISRATLYKYIKQLDTKTQKEGKKTYLTPSQLAEIKHKNGLTDNTKTPNTNTDTRTNTKITNLKAELEREKSQRKKAEQATEKERQKNEDLILQLGQWQGRAKTLEEQNQKLLTAQTETINAEIVEEETPKPRTFGQMWRDFWKD